MELFQDMLAEETKAYWASLGAALCRTGVMMAHCGRCPSEWQHDVNASVFSNNDKGL